MIPEALLDYQDYIQWASKVENIVSCPKDEEQFNVMSDEAWTCVLMQVIKVYCMFTVYCLFVYRPIYLIQNTPS